MQPKNGGPGGDAASASPEGILIVSMAGLIQYCDSGICRLLCCEQNGLVGNNIQQFIQPEEWIIAEAHLRRLAAGDPVTAIACRFLRSNGACVETMASFTLLRGAGQEAPHVMISVALPAPGAGTARAASDLLGDFIAQSPAAMAMFDTRMQYIALSRRWSDDFQLSPPEVIGRSHYDLFPDLPDRWRAVHRRALEGETINAPEDEFRRADGSATWLSWEVRPWRDARGEIGGIVIFSEDITARKQAELALLESRALLQRELVDNKRIRSVAALLAGGGELDVAGQKIVTTARELMRADAACLQEYDDASETMRLVSHCGIVRRSASIWRVLDASSATPCGAALRCKRPVLFGNVDDHIHSARDLEAFRLSGIASSLSLPLISTGGRVVGMLSVHWKEPRERMQSESVACELLARFTADFIARSRAMDELRKSEERYRLVLRASGAGVWFWKPGSRTMSWDDPMLAIFGFSPGENPTLEKSLARIHAEDRAQFEDHLKSILEPSGGDEWNAEVRIVHPDGKIIWMQGLGRAFRNADGSVAEIVGISLDITARKAVEQQLADARRLEAVGQLAGSISHDLNNLLAVISGTLELAIGRIEDDKARQLIGKAAEAARLGGSYNRRLSSFLRPSPPAAVPVDVNESAEEMFNLMGGLIGQGIRLSAKLAPELWPASADPGEIGSALLNLLTNSRDAMPNGGRIVIETANVTLTAAEAGALHAAARAGDYVRLRVTDDGIGMPDAVLQQAVAPFFTTKLPGLGTGLGLPSVANFASQAGGFLTVRSAPGQGCEASIYLPRAARAAMRPASPGAEIPMGDGELVLVVEDDARVREATLQRLEGLGYAVEEARSAREAMHLLHSGLPVRAVLSDIIMPGGMSGYDLAHWVAANMHGMGVILCTGHDPLGFGPAGANAPFDGAVLSKPFTREELAVAMRNALNEQPVQASRTVAEST